jgi:hypothetical protein
MKLAFEASVFKVCAPAHGMVRVHHVVRLGCASSTRLGVPATGTEKHEIACDFFPYRQGHSESSTRSKVRRWNTRTATESPDAKPASQGDW